MSKAKFNAMIASLNSLDPSLECVLKHRALLGSRSDTTPSSYSGQPAWSQRCVTIHNTDHVWVGLRSLVARNCQTCGNVGTYLVQLAGRSGAGV
jgi:hypothetical protein